MTRLRVATGRTFRSLHVRNYRLYFFGQMVSMTGTWMQTIAQGWLVYRLTKSGTAIGGVYALQFLPFLIMGPWGGVIADRFDKRRTLVFTQSLMAVFAGVLAVLTITDVIQLWQVYLLAFLTGSANAFDNPTRQAFVSEMVGPEDLANAVGLNSAMFNVARIFGPAAAGLLIKFVGIGQCFGANAVSYLAVIGSLLAMRNSELFSVTRVARAKGQIRAGFAYVWRTPVLRSTILVVTVVGTLALNFSVVLPLVAAKTFHGDAGTYGLITSFMGAGSLIGALATASRGRPTPKLLFGTCLAFGVLMTAAALAPTLRIELLLLAMMGCAAIAFMASANTTLQLTSSAEMRGRVMALYMLVVLGSTPIGAPIVGWISQHFGPRFGLGIGGVSTLLAAIAFGGSLLRARGIRRRDAGLLGDPAAEPAAA
jgi:MFS family permease